MVEVRRGVLFLAVLLAWATPARAARVWSAPAPITGAATQDVKLYVAGATELAVWIEADGSLVARYGSAPPVKLATVPGSSVHPAAVSRGGGAIVTWVGGDAVYHTFAVAARSDGTFTAPVDIGPGTPGTVVMNGHGDGAVSTMAYASAGGQATPSIDPVTAYRPAGGPFGASVPLPFGGGLEALSSDGVSFISAPYGIRGTAIYTRPQDGPVASTASAQYNVGTNVFADGKGRALAVLSGYPNVDLQTSVYSDGDWSGPVNQPLDSQANNHYTGEPTAVGAAGDAVIAWRDPGPTGNLRALTGSLADGAFTPAQTLDRDMLTGDPVLAMAPDGTTVIAYVDRPHQSIRVVRRDATGAFTTPQTVACGQAVGLAGIDANGNAVLQIGTTELRDSFSATPVADPVCREPETGSTGPRPSYSRTPILVGQPVTIDDSGIRRADWDLNGCTFTFVATVEQRFVPIIDHTFTAPGRNDYRIDCNERSRADGAGDLLSDTYAVDVFALAALTDAHRARRAVTVKANAFTDAKRAKVRLVVRGHGRALANRAVRLGPLPTLTRVPLPHGARMATRVVLRQDHMVRAIARVRD